MCRDEPIRERILETTRDIAHHAESNQVRVAYCVNDGYPRHMRTENRITARKITTTRGGW